MTVVIQMYKEYESPSFILEYKDIRAAIEALMSREDSGYSLQMLVIDEVLLPPEPLVNSQDLPIIIANQTMTKERKKIC